jgi:elongation factor 1-gamma
MNKEEHSLTFTGESYEYTRLDVSKPADKEFFEGAMAWDLVIDGKEWADGKNFK